MKPQFTLESLQMEEKQMTKFFKNEEGSGLILSLMTLLVLSVLGVSLGTISLGGHRLSGVNRDSSSAYYIAEAGANMAYEEIEKIVTEAYAVSSNKDAFESILNEQIPENFKKYESGVFSTQFGKQPEADIRVYYESNENIREYTIDSKANIGNHNRTAQKKVTVNWVSKDTGGGGTLPSLPSGTSLIAKNSVKMIGGATIHNDIYIDSNVPYPITIEGGARRPSGTTFYNSPLNEFNIYNLPENYAHIDEIKVDESEFVIPWNQYENIVTSFPDIELHSSYPSFPDSTTYPVIYADPISDSGNHNFHKIVNRGNIDHTSYLIDNYSFDLDTDSKIGNIVVGSAKTLILNTGNHNLSIVIDNIDISNGELSIVGTGSVNLFVNGNTNLSQSNFKIQGLKDFNIYSNNINITGNGTNINVQDIIGLYAKEKLKIDNVNLNIDSSRTTLYAKNLEFSNNDMRVQNNANVEIMVPQTFTFSNGSLIFENNNNVNIYTNKFKHSNGIIDTVNTSLLSLFIKDDFNFGSGTINGSGNSNTFLIYYEGINSINYGGSINLNSSVFFKEADMEIGSGVKIYGPVVTGGNKVTLSGGASTSPFLLAPQSLVILKEGGAFNGTVIADKVDLEGGTHIKYEEYNHELFPFGNTGSGNTPLPSLEDIINSDPAIEP